MELKSELSKHEEIIEKYRLSVAASGKKSASNLTNKNYVEKVKSTFKLDL
jgi:hypothetical protein